MVISVHYNYYVICVIYFDQRLTLKLQLLTEKRKLQHLCIDFPTAAARKRKIGLLEKWPPRNLDTLKFVGMEIWPPFLMV